MDKLITNTEFNSLLDYLYNLQRLGIKVGLSHTQDLLKQCGNPQDCFRSIHVAGTNGKGSTCAMLAAILVEAGLKVGLYSSPHLVQFNERIRINGKTISNVEIISFMKRYKKDIAGIKATFFETTTAMAFDHFRNKKVDVAIIETGLGGRLDSTNVIKPFLTAITSISLDHLGILGEDIVSIAKEKAGIIKQNVPLFISKQEKEVEALIEKIAFSNNSPLYKISSYGNIHLDISGTIFNVGTDSFKVPLLGHHQAMNGTLAISIAKAFKPDLSHEIIQKGLMKAQWPGRLQLLSKSPPIIYDVAHNASGISAILQTVKSLFNISPIGLFVMKGDKESNLIAQTLHQFDQLIISGGSKYGLLNAEELRKNLHNEGVKNFSTEVSFSIALDQIINQTKNKKRPGLIFGSHYVAKEIFDKFGFLI